MTNEPSFQSPGSSDFEAQRALEREARLPLTGWQQEVSQGLEYGLEAADSIRDSPQSDDHRPPRTHTPRQATRDLSRLSR